MYRLQIDSVKKSERKYFMAELFKATNGRGNAYTCAEDKVIFEFKDPYIIDEESLRAKNEVKKAVQTFLSDFRMYQFNNQ